MLPIQFKTLKSSLGGRNHVDFGTVRPRVQIPGPRPVLYWKSAVPEGDSGPATDHRITISAEHWNYGRCGSPRRLDHIVEPLTNRDDDLASGVCGVDMTD